MISASLSVLIRGHHCFDLDDPDDWEVQELLADARVDVLTTDDNNVVKVLAVQGKGLLVRHHKVPDSDPYWLL